MICERVGGVKIKVFLNKWCVSQLRKGRWCGQWGLHTDPFLGLRLTAVVKAPRLASEAVGMLSSQPSLAQFYVHHWVVAREIRIIFISV